MKKQIIISFVLLLFMTMVLSCSKSKEEKLIDDFSQLVESIETIAKGDFTVDEYGNCLEATKARNMVRTFGENLITLYGEEIDKVNDLTKESFAKAGLNFSDDQIQQMKELYVRMNTAQSTIRIKEDEVEAQAKRQSKKESEDESLSEPENASKPTNSSFDINKVLIPSVLKGSVEIINAEKSVSSYGFPEMDITFKLLKKVDTSSLLSEYGQMWIIGIGQSDNGVDIKELLPNYDEWRSEDSEGTEFKAFLESEPGETITLQFTGGKDNSQNVSEDLEKVEKFKLKLTN